MKISSVQYSNEDQTFLKVIYDDESASTVPVVGGNRRYQEVLAWMDEGNEIDAYSPLWGEELDDWLDAVIRPRRDILMEIGDKYVLQYLRDIRLGVESTIDIDAVDAWMDALADFPSTFTEIVDIDSVIWPESPIAV